jgi:hypothetical protein
VSSDRVATVICVFINSSGLQGSEGHVSVKLTAQLSPWLVPSHRVIFSLLLSVTDNLLMHVGALLFFFFAKSGHFDSL